MNSFSNGGLYAVDLCKNKTTSALDSLFELNTKGFDNYTAADTVLACLLLMVVLFLIYHLYQICFCPLNITRPHGSVGFIRYGNLSKEKSIEYLLEYKKIGTVPPVFPNGWYAAIESKNVKKGQVKKLNILGENLVAYRTVVSRKVRIIGAYCPHLGADFSNGGVVKGECIQCPFHGWQFDGDSGKLLKIPYSDSENYEKIARLETWHSCEQDGWVYLWYHVDHLKPEYELPKFKEIGEFRHSGYSDHTVDCHIEDIPENVADCAHLQFLHTSVLTNDISNSSLCSSLVQHDITTEWRPKEGEPHIGDADIRHSMLFNIFGKKIKFLSIDFRILQIGPAVVYIKAKGRGIEFCIIQTVTPLKPLRQRVHQEFFFRPYFPNPLSRLIIWTEATQIERDIMVWTNKRYIRRPLLVKEEKLIKQHRKWYQRFYSENSARLTSDGKLVYGNPEERVSLDF